MNTTRVVRDLVRRALQRHASNLFNALQGFAPPPLAASPREFWLASAGAALGLMGTQALAHQWLGGIDPWFVAPMGAAAVLLFAVPASPLAQPWSVLVGNTAAALVGVGCFKWLGATPVAAALAGGAAVAAMFALRCLHPPAGAVAVTAVLGGPAVHHLGFAFATQLVPVNAALLMLTALAFNNLAGRRYPHVSAPRSHATADAPPTQRLVTRGDLQAALAAHGELLDIELDDLEAIVARAHLRAGERRWGEVRCRDVMSRDLITVTSTTSLRQAWILLMRHKIKALPVARADGTLEGILSLHDFFVSAADGRPQASERAVVSELMTRHVRIARAQQPLAELVEAFTDGGLHHLPVLDPQDRLVGMITQSDVLAALFLWQASSGQALHEAVTQWRAAMARQAA